MPAIAAVRACGGSKGGVPGGNRQGRRRKPPPFFPAIPCGKGSLRQAADRQGSLLQLSLQNLDLLRQRGVVADEIFYLADRMQHGGVIPSAETAPDFG